MVELFDGIYKDKKVFLTGHTGFKGSWMALWLKKMGATVKGYSLKPNTHPSHWDLLSLDIESVYGDIRDRDKLEKELLSFNPDIVIHMAAQPLVRLSYLNPFETYEINVMGTMALFEACRKATNLKAIINITTDKCYENKEWIWPYRENEPMGGYDPYSSSKAAVEIMTSSYRRSFFNINDYGVKHKVLLASVRAGNVIGGGDWAKDRLVPDIMKATANGEKVHIRNPKAVRPWQHVLEPLSGYLLLGQKLLEGHKEFASAWNFGPDDTGTITVEEVAGYLKNAWDKIHISFGIPDDDFHEANLLKLDCSKARTMLNWRPVWNNVGFEKTAGWYKVYYGKHQIITESQIDDYVDLAHNSNIVWANKFN